MKKNIQKIISVFFGFAFLFIAHTSYAGVIWNNAVDSCEDLRIANYTTNTGYGSCWSLTQVNASPGDTINVRIYYENTGDTIATNVRLVLTASDIATSTNVHRFSGQIISDQGIVNLGQVSLNLSSNQTLSFNSSYLYPNQSQSPVSKGSDMVNGGILVGNIAPGRSSQGTAVAVFKVGNYVAPQYCPSGTTGTYPNCTSIVCPTNTTGTYPNCTALTCPNGYTGSYPNCNPPQPQYCPSGTTGTYPNCTAIIYQCPTGYTGVYPNCNRPEPQYCPTGMIGTYPNCTWPQPTPYCPSGTTGTYPNCTAIIYQCPTGYTGVYPNCNRPEPQYCPTGMIGTYPNCTWPQQYCPSGTTGTYPNCTNIQQNNCSISSFTINGSSSSQINTGSSATLYWNTNNCTAISISNVSNSYSQNTSGSQTVFPYGDTRYVLTAYGQNGYTETRTVNAYTNQYNNNYCTISYFNANPTSISQGNSSYLSWSTNNCSSVNISNIGNVSNSGSQNVYPNYSTNYTLTAYGNNGNPSQSVYVSVASAPVYYNNNTVCAVTNSATDVSQNSAQLNGTLSGSNSTNTYFEYGTSTGFGNRTTSRVTYGSNTFNESIQGLLPDTTYFYRLVSNCGNGQVLSATSIFKTNRPTIIERIVQTFVPQRIVEVQQPIVQTINTVGTVSPIMLSIENRYENIGEGDTVDYTIKYKNIGNTILTRPLLQVIVPEVITLTNASNNGSYLNDDKTLSFILSDLAVGQEGTVYAQGKVKNLADANAKIVSKALLVYTTPNNTQENAIAYVTNVPKNYNGSVLGAAAFFGGLFSIGIIGWLLLLILILVIILIAKSFMNRNTKSNYQEHGPMGH